MRMKTQRNNLWDTFKTVSRGKFIAINAHMRSEERSKIYTLSSKLKELEEEDQENSKAWEAKVGGSRRQEIKTILVKVVKPCLY